jgi:hypothetical protein
VSQEQTPAVSAADQPVRIGGLMRCCTLTLRETPRHGTEGEELPCNYCSSSMRFSGGSWGWAGAKP